MNLDTALINPLFLGTKDTTAPNTALLLILQHLFEGLKGSVAKKP